MLKIKDLASRPDLRLGPVEISPARRLLKGPGGEANLEPLNMQVLLLLLDGRGNVVTRDELFYQCWGGTMVGDDSLNQAVAKVRKSFEKVAAGAVEIETIPRTGYRLTLTDNEAQEVARTSGPGFPRRRVIAGAGAAAVLATGGGFWLWRNRAEAHFQQLIDSAEDAVRREDLGERTVQTLQQAVSIRPDSAKAWGLLALVRSVLAPRDPKVASDAVLAAEQTARHALALDPNEPNALLAMFELQGASLDWITRDRRLRRVIAIDPRNVGAILELALLTAAAGLIGESWDWNERGLALEPLSADFLGRRALKLWIAGRVPDADKVIDQVRGLYPQHPWVWWVRFFLFAMTGRPRAAQAMIDADPQMIGNPAQARLWRASLPALDKPSPTTLAKARQSCIDGGRDSGFIATQAALIMCALGDIDTAYDIANAVLFSRGPIIRRPEQDSRSAAEDAGWRVGTQWMWTPPAATMRADPRFLPLCDGVGLVDYWRKRGVTPDSLRNGN